LTTGKWSVGAGELRGGGSIDWTPDSKSIVFDANRSPDADLQHQTSQLLVVDVTTGAIRDLVAKPGSWDGPVVSPDGRMVAFTGYAPTGRSHTVSDLFVIPLAAGAGDGMRKISGDFDREPINVRWAPDGTGLYFDADDHGARNVHLASVVGGVKPVTNGRHLLTFDSVSKDLVAAGVSADPDHPQDVVRYNLRQPGQVVKLTDVNGDVLQGKQLAKVEEITYTSSGNAKVQGWVVKPPAFDASKKYPLILEIHGGPFELQRRVQLHVPELRRERLRSALHEPAGQHRVAASSSTASITITRPRLRRPDGRRRRGHGKGYIDTSRMSCRCSGGGVLSSWVIGKTDRFAAAAVRCPVIDWISMAGQTDVPSSPTASSRSRSGKIRRTGSRTRRS
jgi:dipeptidyl aminopeptidase/acylaminoacyl peptidase